MTRLSFGGFELDPHTGELWKGPDCVRIQDQPLKLLLCLLERPGQIVGRDELQKRVWDGDIHVSFEDGLNAAAWRLRQVLGDSADDPRFIETIPRKGYRFVEKVVPLPGKAPPASGSFPMPVFRPPSSPGLEAMTERRGFWRRHRLGVAAAVGIGLLGIGTGGWFAMKSRLVPLVVTPLGNVTGDPALDYFASALSRQVAQDLERMPGLEVQAMGAWPGAPEPWPKGALILTWTVGREVQGYRVTVSLADVQGRSRGDRMFLVAPEDLHGIHRVIADYVAEQAQGPRPEGRWNAQPGAGREARADGEA